jgi:uncharacterized protein
MTKPAPPANDNADAKAESAKPAAACPICGRPRAEKCKPFCSARCADVDLYRWLNGKYAIPASEEGEPGEGTGHEDE